MTHIVHIISADCFLTSGIVLKHKSKINEFHWLIFHDRISSRVLTNKHEESVEFLNNEGGLAPIPPTQMTSITLLPP